MIRRSLILHYLAILLLAMGGSVREADAQAARLGTVRGMVVDVVDGFCKLNVDADDGVQVGDFGTLHRLQSGEKVLADIQVTAVAAEYAVCRVSGTEPQLGDYVLISLRERRPIAKPEVQPKTPTKPTPPPAAEKSADPPPTPPTQAKSGAPVDKLDGAVDSRIDIEPKKGNPLKNVKLVKIVRDNKSGAAKLLYVEQLDQKKWTVGVPSVKRVFCEGKLIFGLPADAAETNSAPPVSALRGDKGAAAPKTRKQLLEEAEAKRAAEEREKWLARLQVAGIEPWPELSVEEHQGAIRELKELVQKIVQQYPDMTLHETEQFLFCTNIPQQQVGPYVMSLDAMYDMLTKMYRVPKGAPVWRGKALVVAFLQQEQFIQFEQQFMQHSPGPETYGLCHQKSNGEVIMACYRGDRAADFGHMLVHETSHGFIHRYRTAERLPTWVNEGMAEWIGQALVPASRAVRNSQQMAHGMMKQSRSMGGNLLTAEGGIDTWQYGVSSSLTDFMIRTNKKAYVEFIEGMKEGLDWQASLLKSYNATPEQLVSAYGQAIGIPDLKP